MSSVDVSALQSYASSYERQLIVTLVNMLDIRNDIRVIPNVKDDRPLTKLNVKDGTRPFSSTKEFKTGDLEYTDRKLSVAPGKREILIDPEDYRTTYLSQFLTAGSGANKKEIPFASFTWQEVIKAVAAEVNNKTAWFGFDGTTTSAYNSGSTYSDGDRVTFTQGGIKEWFQANQAVATNEDPDTNPEKWDNVTAEAISQGLKEIIEDEITATNISPVATGAITDGPTALAAFRKLFRAMPTPYKRSGVIIHAPFTDYEFLLDGIESEITKFTRDDVTRGFLFLPGTNQRCTVKPATWQGDSRRLVAEPWMGGDSSRGGNLVMGTDLLSDMNQIETNPDLWTLEAGIKFVIGWQLSDLEALRVGDQV